jgi:predicted HicB family RNase H-like nuclease
VRDPDIERERVWRDPQRRRQWAMQLLNERWQRRKRLEQELTESWRQRIAEAQARNDLGILNADDLVRKLQDASEDDRAYFLRQAKRDGIPPLKNQSRVDTKIVEALEDEKFLYSEQQRFFGRRFRKKVTVEDAAAEEKATVRKIVADFHGRSVDQLKNYEKNKYRTKSA